MIRSLLSYRDGCNHGIIVASLWLYYPCLCDNDDSDDNY